MNETDTWYNAEYMLMMEELIKIAQIFSIIVKHA